MKGSGEVLDESLTFMQAGIKDSDMLLVDCGNNPPVQGQKVSSSSLEHMAVPDDVFTQKGYQFSLKPLITSQKISSNEEQSSPKIPPGWTIVG
jgi:hypothetical protein